MLLIFTSQQDDSIHERYDMARTTLLSSVSLQTWKQDSSYSPCMFKLLRMGVTITFVSTHRVANNKPECISFNTDIRDVCHSGGLASND